MVLIVVVAAVATFVTKRVVRRALRRTFALAGVDPSRAEARQRAVSAALRSAIVGVIWAIAVITVISEFGVNIGAFVATATVIGGAIAFGAQQLLRDLIAGFFVLAEDQYGVGDEVDLGHATGRVERITLRMVRLRDPVGAVWYVPHGGVSRVANLSKSSAAAIDIDVSRSMSRTALDEVAAELCAELAADAEVGPLLAGAPQAVGIVEVRDDRFVFRLKAGTVAGAHDTVRARWRQMVLDSFDDGRLRAP